MGHGLDPSCTPAHVGVRHDVEAPGVPVERQSLVLVTHQVNITALTGIFPRSGEIVVLRLGGPENFTIIGAISAL